MKSDLQKKAYWQSRRGLHELDLILIPFVKNYFAELNKINQFSFMELLENEDVVLMDWLVYKQIPPQQFIKIVDLILNIEKFPTNE
tara:strand:+ start:153 stop:410 length:258 start_codon:yes stop_codon:yes gene_type:complete